MTTTDHFVACATALALSRGGIVEVDGLIMRTGEAMLKAAPLRKNARLVGLLMPLTAIFETIKTGDEIAFSGARHDLVTALGRYWAEVSAAGEETA